MTSDIYVSSRVAFFPVLMKTKKSRHKSLDIPFSLMTSITSGPSFASSWFNWHVRNNYDKTMLLFSTPPKWQTYQAQVLFNQSTPIPLLALLCHPRSRLDLCQNRITLIYLSPRTLFPKNIFLLDFSCSARSRLRSRLLILSRALWRVWDEKFRDLLLRNVNWISYGVVAFILRPQRKKPREAESKSSSSVIKCEIFFSVLGSKKTKLCSTSSWNGDWGRRDDMLWRGEDNEFSFRSIFKAFVNLGNPRSFACIIGRGPEVSLKFFRRIKLTAARALPPAG